MAQLTQNNPSQESISSMIQYYRTLIGNGSLTPQQAQSQFSSDMLTYIKVNNPQGYSTGVIDQYTQQLLAPMTINANGKISQMSQGGGLTSNSTTINQSTTTGAGTTSSTSFSTPGANGSYTVKSGDTLSQIAADKGMSLQQLLSLNPQFQANPNAINPGQTVNLGTNASTPTTGGSNPTTGTSGAGGGGLTPPKPTPTGNPTLDAAQNGQYQYVTGSLEQGYTINPALIGTSLAAMLPTFINETISQLEPELQQNFSTEMVGIKNSLTQLTTTYQNQQGQTIQDFEQSLGTLRDSSSMMGGQERALETGLMNSANRSLSSLDTNFGTSVSSVLNAGGAALGPGAFGSIMSQTGSAPESLLGLNASALTPPNVSSQTVNLQGGNSIFAGSSGAGNPLNFNYDPSMYTYGSIPSNFGTNFGDTLNQLFGNYQKGAAATPNITSSSGLTL